MRVSYVVGAVDPREKINRKSEDDGKVTSLRIHGTASSFVSR